MLLAREHVGDHLLRDGGDGQRRGRRVVAHARQRGHVAVAVAAAAAGALLAALEVGSVVAAVGAARARLGVHEHVRQRLNDLVRDGGVVEVDVGARVRRVRRVVQHRQRAEAGHEVVHAWGWLS